MNLLRAYVSFYNPINTVRTLLGIRSDSVSPKQFMHQFIGQIGLLLTIPRMLAWAWRLKRGPIEPYDGLAPARIPMIDTVSGNEINWAVEHVPSGRLRPPVGACRSALSRHRTTDPCELITSHQV